MRSPCRTGWIGIEWGARAVKIAQVERAGDEVRLRQSRVIPRPLSGYDAEDPASAVPWWEEVCRCEGLTRGFAGRDAACVLPAGYASFRAMNIPDGTDRERRAMIASELEEILGEAGPPFVFDYWDTAGPGPGQAPASENVQVVSLEQDVATRISNSLDRTGIDCHVLDALPLAIARAASRAPGPIVAMDWGFESALLCLVDEGRPIFTRQLRDCGLRKLIAAVREALGMSWTESERVLQSYGLPDPAGTANPFLEIQKLLGNIVQGAMTAVVSEIRRTLAYPAARSPAISPKSLCLMGGGATVRHVEPYLSGRLGLPVRSWNVPSEGGTAARAGSAMFAVSASLSMLAWER